MYARARVDYLLTASSTVLKSIHIYECADHSLRHRNEVLLVNVNKIHLINSADNKVVVGYNAVEEAKSV